MKDPSQVRAEYSETVGVQPSDAAAVLPVGAGGRQPRGRSPRSALSSGRGEEAVGQCRSESVPRPTVAEAKDNERRATGGRFAVCFPHVLPGFSCVPSSVLSEPIQVNCFP